jgi:hypothetical protein
MDDDFHLLPDNSRLKRDPSVASAGCLQRRSGRERSLFGPPRAVGPLSSVLPNSFAHVPAPWYHSSCEMNVGVGRAYGKKMEHVAHNDRAAPARRH